MGINPEYFWMEIELPEIDMIVKAHVEEYRDRWEQTRLIAYNAASGMSKMPPMRKFLPFSWDSESKNPTKNKSKRRPSADVMKYITENLKINPNVKL